MYIAMEAHVIVLLSKLNGKIKLENIAHRRGRVVSVN